MVHFVKSAVKNLSDSKETLAMRWEKQFLSGLESLLVECAVVPDDIERDCFVSRVYCWFTEKLAERRELPRIVNRSTYDDLRSSLNKYEGSAHTMRAINSYNPDEQSVAMKLLYTDRIDRHLSGDVGDKDDVSLSLSAYHCFLFANTLTYFHSLF